MAVGTHELRARKVEQRSIADMVGAERQATRTAVMATLHKREALVTRTARKVQRVLVLYATVAFAIKELGKSLDGCLGAEALALEHLGELDGASLDARGRDGLDLLFERVAREQAQWHGGRWADAELGASCSPEEVLTAYGKDDRRYTGLQRGGGRVCTAVVNGSEAACPSPIDRRRHVGQQQTVEDGIEHRTAIGRRGRGGGVGGREISIVVCGCQ